MTSEPLDRGAELRRRAAAARVHAEQALDSYLREEWLEVARTWEDSALHEERARKIKALGF